MADHLHDNTDYLHDNTEWLRRHRLDSYILQTIHQIVRQELRKYMAGKQYIISEEQLAQLTGAETGIVQAVSDAATAVNTEIASIPTLIQTAADAAVKKALADARVSSDVQPADISSALAALANIQGGVHNIGVAAQLAGASAPAVPAPPVSDPATGTPVAVTDPTVVLPAGMVDTSDTPTAPPAAAGTDGSGEATA